TIAPLRERRDEILPLARHLLQDIASTYDESPKTLSPAVENTFMRYDWPGNVRELRNALERAFLFCTDRTIDLAHLPSEVGEAAELPTYEGLGGYAPTGAEAIPRLADAERILIERVLRLTGGNQSDAARLLDVERHRLRRKIVTYGLEHLARI